MSLTPKFGRTERGERNSKYGHPTIAANRGEDATASDRAVKVPRGKGDVDVSYANSNQEAITAQGK